jgi:hypothetical protein
VARLAPLVFFRRQACYVGMAGITAFPLFVEGKACSAVLTCTDVPRLVGQEVSHYVRLTCTSFGHAPQLKIELKVRYDTGVAMANDAGRIDEKVRETDWVHVVFAVTPKEDVTAVTVTFQKGFARRRSALVGRVLGEVKNVDGSKAQLFVEALAGCEDAGSGKVGEKVASVPIVQARDVAGSSEERRVSVTTQPCDSSGNITVVLCAV